MALAVMARNVFDALDELHFSTCNDELQHFTYGQQLHDDLGLTQSSYDRALDSSRLSVPAQDMHYDAFGKQPPSKEGGAPIPPVTSVHPEAPNTLLEAM